MSSSNDFIQHVSELLAPAGRVTVKRMFGGHGVYVDGLFMAIIANDEGHFGLPCGVVAEERQDADRVVTREGGRHAHAGGWPGRLGRMG